MTSKLLACLPFALALLGIPAAHAQAPVKPVEVKFGKPELADFEAKSFVADSGAAAVVLYDFGTTRFEYGPTGFVLVTERLTRIKVLKKAGYDVATVEVGLYHRDKAEEKLSSLRGFTYNMVGGKLEKTKLETSTAFTEERSKHVRVRKFTLPAVREGAVIEYAYSVTSDFFSNFQDWTFQREYPTRWSEYRAIIPEYFDYKLLMQGYVPLALQTREDGATQFTVRQAGGFVQGSTFSEGSGRVAASAETFPAKTTNYHWAMQNVPALREESFMTTPLDYVARIDFELAGTRFPGSGYRNVAGTWEKINADLLQDSEFGGQLDRAGFLAEAVKPLVAQYPDPAARTAAVRALVVAAVKHDGTNTFYASAGLKKVYELHRGNSADVNLLLIAALRQAGLPDEPVILSTRAHGRVNQNFPLLEQFNYVVGLLPLPGNQELLLDATDPLLPCGMLPRRCLSQTGRLVAAKDGAGRWVSLLPNQRHNHFQEVKMSVDAQGNLSGQVREEFSGYSAAVAREKLQTLGEKKYVSDLAAHHPNWEIPTYQFADIAALSQPLALRYELRQAATTPATATELYLSPLAAFGAGRNPFAQAERNYPVDFGAPTQEVIMLTLSLPAGYGVSELPKPAVLALPEQGGRFLYSVSAPAPGTVQLISRLTLDKAVYGAEEYASLREFYRLALAKQAEALVIKKL